MTRMLFTTDDRDPLPLVMPECGRSPAGARD